MFDRFKNLDKKQKIELYKVLWSICALIGVQVCKSDRCRC